MRSDSRVAGLLLACLIAAGPASAAPVLRDVNDGTGRGVAIPAAPERIVTLYDNLLALPLYELGLPPVGSLWQVTRPDGTREVMGLQPLFGVTGSEAGITPVWHGGSYDIEAIRLLSPDLIIGTEGDAALLPLLQRIAPVFLHRSHSADSRGLDGTRRLARDLGLQARLATLEAEYEGRAARLRAMLPPPARPDGDRVYAVLFLNDGLIALTGPGGIIEAVEDLGFRQPEWLHDISANGFSMPLSAEALPRIDADLLIVVKGFGIGSDDEARAALDRAAPGWHLLMGGRAPLFVDGDRVMTMTFASAHEALEAVARHYALDLPARE
ncbi:ABC transporter substrate-binding protein [Paracoccus sp. NSM]|uniref:ABC transporter substrate-binding protein n=1 Tax=Paracoccus sp. NSM TaxID=3457784 RepID=UPI004035F5BF